MRRAILLAAGTALAAVVGLTAYLAKTPAAPPKPPPPPVVADGPPTAAAASETSVQLPIGQVVLFSSGVGYFQREGTVEGNARVDLSFPVQDINDLLKSMVLRDLDGGHISHRLLRQQRAGREDAASASPSTSTAIPSFGAILNQARGEKVEVVLQQTNADAARHADRHRRRRREAEAGGRQGHRRSRTAEPVVRRRHAQRQADRRAAGALPQPDHRQRVQEGAGNAGAVARHAEEGGEHQLRRRRQAATSRSATSIENPIWKTSYRLVLDKEKEESRSCKAGPSSRTRPTRTGRTCAWPWSPVGRSRFQMDLYHAALRAAAGGRAGTVRLAPARRLQRRSRIRNNAQWPGPAEESPTAAQERQAGPWRRAVAAKDTAPSAGRGARHERSARRKRN